MDRTHLTNGRFLHTLDPWTAAGGATYSAGDGDDHYGVAVLPAGSSIRQDLAVVGYRRYTLHLAVKGGNATVTIADGDGNTVLTTTASGSAGVWTETSITAGLASGTTYRLTISNGGASSISIDDVWLWWVPKTRAELAAMVHRKLGQLATDASLSTTASGDQTEGSYTDAIDAGLRSVGAIDPETDLADVRWLDAGLLDTCLDAIEREVLERLQRHYAVLTDIKVGERDEKLSQIGAAIAKLTGSGRPGGGKVVVRGLRRRADDYEFG
jgi:hypothetical protein